jgi:hypothetical protein
MTEKALGGVTTWIEMLGLSSFTGAFIPAARWSAY